MDFSPSMKARRRRLAFIWVILVLGVAACSPGRAQIDKAGVEPDSVKTDAPSVSQVDKLQGRWRSRSDTSASIEIKGNTFLSLYDGAIVSSGILEFVNSCEDRSHVPQSEFFIVSDAADTLCYHLTVVEDAFLEFVYIPRGSTLSYERVEQQW